MIITETFVWINYPRSGSTFARKAIRRLYDLSRWNISKRYRMRDRWMKEIECPEHRLPSTCREYGTPTPHGTVSQIPSEHAKKQIATSMRDPFEKAISHYRFGNWRKPELWPKPIESLHERYSDFANLDFQQYLELMVEYRSGQLRVGAIPVEIGPWTFDFLSFFASISHKDRLFEYSSWDALRSDLDRIRFLNLDRLNAELFGYLRSIGFARQDIFFILGSTAINSSKTVDVDAETTTVEFFDEHEWLLKAIYQETISAETRLIEREAQKRSIVV